jgi:hypothetical protein
MFSHCTKCATDVRSNVYFLSSNKTSDRHLALTSKSGAVHRRLLLYNVFSVGDCWVLWLPLRLSESICPRYSILVSVKVKTFHRSRLRFNSRDHFFSFLLLPRLSRSALETVGTVAAPLLLLHRSSFASTSLCTKCRRSQWLCSDGENTQFHFTASTAFRHLPRHSPRYSHSAAPTALATFERGFFAVERDLRPSAFTDLTRLRLLALVTASLQRPLHVVALYSFVICDCLVAWLLL